MLDKVESDLYTWIPDRSKIDEYLLFYFAPSLAPRAPNSVTPAGAFRQTSHTIYALLALRLTFLLFYLPTPITPHMAS